MTKYEVHIRRGVLINDDPLSRCYNGCFYNFHVEWAEWEYWMDYPDLESAGRACRIFARGNQQLKVVVNEGTTHTDS